MHTEQLKKYYEKHFNRTNTIKAYGLLNNDTELICFLLDAYNCYAIKYNLKHERSAMSLITNPDEFLKDCENVQQFIDDFKKYIIETIENKYINYKGNEQNGCQNNRSK